MGEPIKMKTYEVEVEYKFKVIYTLQAKDSEDVRHKALHDCRMSVGDVSGKNGVKASDWVINPVTYCKVKEVLELIETIECEDIGEGVNDMHRIHGENLRLIAMHNLEIGDTLRCIRTGKDETITSIHKLYGWVTCGHTVSTVPQEVSSIMDGYIHIKKYKEDRDL